MNKKKLEKYLYIGLTASGVVIVGIFCLFLIFQWKSVKKAFDMIMVVMKPFIYGAVIAYLLAPVCSFFEKYMKKALLRLWKEPIEKDKEKEDIRRKKRKRCINKISNIVGLIVTFLLTFVLIIGLVALVIPQINTSMIKISALMEHVPDMLDDLSIKIQQLLEKYPEIEANVLTAYNEAAQYIENWVRNDLLPNWSILIGNVSSGVMGVANVLKNLFIGIIAAVYFLCSKDIFIAQMKKIIYSLAGAKRGNRIIEEARYTHKVFGGFIVGKIIDSFIIGVLCFIVMWFFRMPYAVLVSVIVGVTNIIPFFGPYIGAIPSAILILLVSPVQCLQFIIFVTVLQQFDGNILGPKILGDSTGLTGFWVLFSIMVFGAWMGFVGMLIGVPVFAVIYNAIRRLTNVWLKKKGLSTVTEDYVELKEIDEDKQYIRNKE